MPVPNKTNIAHRRGDSLTIQVTVWNDALKTDPTDMTGATCTAQVREDPDDTTVVATFDVTVDSNVITATLSPPSARALPPLSFWDVQVDWFSDDTSVQTLAAGGLATEPDVTLGGGRMTDMLEPTVTVEVAVPGGVLLDAVPPDPLAVDVVTAVGPPGATGPVGPTGPAGLTRVDHGTTPGVPRPDSPVVLWVGSVEPSNADQSVDLIVWTT